MNQTTHVINQPWNVRQALSAFGLSLESMQRIARASAAARAESLEIDPAFTPGMLSYIYGTRKLRLELLPLGWRVCRDSNVESVVSDEYGMQIQFQNVDLACDFGHTPQSVSNKGSAVRQQIEQGACQLNFPFYDKPDTVLQLPRKAGANGPMVWLLCVSVDGQHLRAELSQPNPFKAERIQSFGSRIFLLDEPTTPSVSTCPPEESDNALDFEIEVVRK